MEWRPPFSTLLLLHRGIWLNPIKSHWRHSFLNWSFCLETSQCGSKYSFRRGNPIHLVNKDKKVKSECWQLFEAWSTTWNPPWPKLGKAWPAAASQRFYWLFLISFPIWLSDFQKYLDFILFELELVCSLQFVGASYSIECQQQQLGCQGVWRGRGWHSLCVIQHR